MLSSEVPVGQSHGVSCVPPLPSHIREVTMATAAAWIQGRCHQRDEGRGRGYVLPSAFEKDRARQFILRVTRG